MDCQAIIPMTTRQSIKQLLWTIIGVGCTPKHPMKPSASRHPTTIRVENILAIEALTIILSLTSTSRITVTMLNTDKITSNNTSRVEVATGHLSKMMPKRLSGTMPCKQQEP